MILEALNELTSGLDAAGVAAFTDVRDAWLPGVLVMPEAAAFDRLDQGTATVTWQLVLMPQQAGGDSTITDLDDLLKKVGAAFPGAFQDVTFDTLRLPNISPDPINIAVINITTENQIGT